MLIFLFRGAKVGNSREVRKSESQKGRDWRLEISSAVRDWRLEISPIVRKIDLHGICRYAKQLNRNGNRYICTMETQELISEPLNKQQLLMLRLFKRPMPEDSFEQIRKLAVKLLASQLDEKIDDWEKENGITEEYYEQQLKQHFRSSPGKHQ